MNATHRLPLRRLSAPIVGAVLLLLAPGVASGQASSQPPVLATVLVPDSQEPALAVESYGVSDAPEPALVVRFAEPFDLPQAFRYRIDLHVGSPTAEHQRVSFVAESGVPTGAVEVGFGADWESTGAVAVDFADGVLTTGLPEDLRDEDGDLAWVEVALVEVEGSAADRFTTPLLPASDVLQHVGPTVAASPWSWGSVDEQPPLDAVETGDAPQMGIEDDKIVIAYSAPVPLAVDGRPVAVVADVVRLTDAMTDGARAPYLLVVDHAAGTVSLLDGRTLIPSEVPTDGSWIVEGLPALGVVAGTEITVSLPAVLDAFGIEVTDPTTDSELGLGIARSVRLDDDRVLRSDGVVAASSWLTGISPGGGTSTTISPTAAPVPSVEEAAKGRGQLVVPAAIIACLVALIGTAAFFLLRWLEHRRNSLAMGPPTPPRSAAPSSVEDQAMLDEFSHQLFDGD